jgi:hypothetical protein
MRYPYGVWEDLFGEYDPKEEGREPIFSVWYLAQKQAYLSEHPDAYVIDGHLVEGDLIKFFMYLDEKVPKEPRRVK